MKKSILFIICLFISTLCFSQREFNNPNAGNSGAANSNFDIYTRSIDLNEKALAFGLTEAEFNAIKEEAYSNASFINGNIYQDENLIKSGVPMRFNAYADEIEIKNNPSDKKYGALTKDPSIFVKINTDIYVFFPYEGSNKKGGYFNALTDGKTYSLYKKTTAKFMAPEKAKTSYQKDTKPSFNKTTKYYLMHNGTLLELPTNKSKVLSVMDIKKNEIKQFINENKLDVDKEEDLIKIVAYFDSLL